MDPFVSAMQGQPLAPGAPPIDRAIDQGARAGGVGGAFMAGYQAALRALVPSLPADGVVCLAASEAGGAHPRAIATRLEPDGAGWRLDGRKRWVTGGTRAGRLLVVASTGVDPAGKNRLRVAQVDPGASGVALVAQPPTPFVPELPHASVELVGVRVRSEDLLEGDGWERYLKPFRTLEDLHVHGAVLAHVLGLGWRAGWPDRLLEEGLALLAATRCLAGEEPSSRATHLALAGLLGSSRALLERTRELWPGLGPEAAAALGRDLPLLEVAGSARARRTAVAWQALRGALVSFD